MGLTCDAAANIPTASTNALARPVPPSRNLTLSGELDNSLTCNWLFNLTYAVAGSTAVVELVSVSTEASFDFVSVKRGSPAAFGADVFRVSGSALPSPSRFALADAPAQLTAVFTSDDSVQSSGFSLRVLVCLPGQYAGPAGTCVSCGPGLTAPSAASSTCVACPSGYLCNGTMTAPCAAGSLCSGSSVQPCYAGYY